MNLETKITIYKFTPQVFTLTLQSSVIICYIYCYTLKTPQKNVAVTEK